MNFTAPACDPSWALPAALIALGVLLVWLGLAGWALKRNAAFDPHAEPFGEQPRLPGEKGSS